MAFYLKELLKRVQGPNYVSDGGVVLFDGNEGKQVREAGESSIQINLLKPLQASKVVVTESDGHLANADTSVTEINYVKGATSNIQEQINALSASPSRYAIVTGAGGNLTSGKYLDVFSGNPSDESPLIIAENSILRALSVSVKTNATCTFTVFKNNNSIETISLSSSRRNSSSGLVKTVSVNDEIKIQLTSGSCTQANLILFFETTL